jgi:hypothetical protein
MKLKELSFTDLIAIFSAISILVSIASQTYFYFRLDALWILSFLTPSIYFIEVIRVMILFILIFFNAICIEELFKWGLKYIVKKKKVRLSTHQNSYDLLTKSYKKYETNQTIFFGVILFVEWVLLNYCLGYFSITILIFVCAISGLILALLTDKTLDRMIRFVTLGLIILFITALNGELKIRELKQTPKVFVKDNPTYEYKVLEAIQNRVIVFDDKKTNIEIKIVPIDDIEKIVVEKRSN